MIELCSYLLSKNAIRCPGVEHARVLSVVLFVAILTSSVIGRSMKWYVIDTFVLLWSAEDFLERPRPKVKITDEMAIV